MKPYTGCELEPMQEPSVAAVVHENVRYTVFVSACEEVSTKLEFQVFKISQVRIQAEGAGSDYVASCLKTHFEQPGMYFSADPRIASLNMQGADQATLWSSGSHFCVFGFIGSAVIERRTPGYQGKRYFARGTNQLGCAGNQLIVQLAGHNAMAIRGQMPVAFSQTPNMRPAPIPKIEATERVSAYLHCLRDMGCTQRIAFVNLIDNHGWQKQLAKQFLSGFMQHLEATKQKYDLFTIHVLDVDAVQQLRQPSQGALFPIDFALLRKIRLEKAEYSNELAFQTGVVVLARDVAYVHIDYHATIHRSSDGAQFSYDIFNVLKSAYGEFVPRINCVDSLDRTNAVLSQYLAFLGHNGLTRELVDGGNFVSNQYASSNAMKQDVVLHGRRTTRGKLQDLVTWARRLLFNNLKDGKLMDGYRLVQQEFRSEKKGQLSFSVLLLIAAVLIIAAIATIVVKVPGTWQRALGSTVSVLCILALFVLFCLAFGELIAAKGKL